MYFLRIGSLDAQTVIEVEGNVSGIWEADTIKVLSNLVVPINENLTINPGSVIKFMGFYTLDIKGSIHAIGMPNNSITFTVYDTTGFTDYASKSGGWNRILLVDQPENADSTIFDFCSFEYSKTDTSQLHGGVLFIDRAHRVRISNCTFHNNKAYVNGGAIFFTSSKAIVKNNLFTKNSSGNDVDWGYGGAICSVNSDVQISRNSFIENSSTGIGGAFSFEFIAPWCDANIFENNYSPLGGAISVLRASGGAITNNLIVNNQSLFFGGAIALVSGSPVILNNTIVANHSTYGGGLYCNEESNPQVINNIFWGNNADAGYGRQVFIWDALSEPKFYNCNFEHGQEDFAAGGYHGIYQDCIELEPIFEGNSPTPFALNENSPCIDAGLIDIDGLPLYELDLAGNPRVQNQRIDIGAYEFQGNSSIISPHTDSNQRISISYCAQSESIIVLLYLTKPNKDGFLSIYNISGQLINRYHLGPLKNEIYKVKMPLPRFVSNGIYVGFFFSGNEVMSTKFAVTR